MNRTLLLLPLTLALALWPARPATADEEDSIEPVASKTVVEAGRTRVLTFRLAAPAAGDRVLATSVDDPSHLSVVEPPTVLAGRRLGLVRLRGGRPGRTVLRLGDAAVAIEVVAGRRPADGGPVVVSPADGAVVWGRLAVGVETADRAAAVVLRLPGGQVVEPVEESHPADGPTRRLLFEVDADAWPAGAVELVAVAGGRAGPPVAVTVARPAAADLDVREAEESQGFDWVTALGVEDDIDEGGEHPHLELGVDPGASGEEYAALHSGWPPVSFEVDVPADANSQDRILGALVTFSFVAAASGKDPIVGYEIECRACRGRWPATPTRYESVGRRPGDLSALIRSTQPGLTASRRPDRDRTTRIDEIA